MNQFKSSLILVALSLMISSCGGSEPTPADANAAPVEIYKPAEKANPNGVGPITDLVLEEFNPTIAAEGEAIFTTNCTACHKMEKRHVGPALGGVLARRTPAWVQNMILNPEKMVAEDPTAKALLAEYLSPMANQNLTEEQSRAVIEYFRKFDMENPQ